ncbi:hypothetical protein Pelo_9314 [Pelomyxa schiedti]|nr:hypothetical protein Pelo_9314 [Pelomyxa schiedti]
MATAGPDDVVVSLSPDGYMLHEEDLTVAGIMGDSSTRRRRCCCCNEDCEVVAYDCPGPGPGHATPTKDYSGGTSYHCGTMPSGGDGGDCPDWIDGFDVPDVCADADVLARGPSEAREDSEGVSRCSAAATPIPGGAPDARRKRKRAQGDRTSCSGAYNRLVTHLHKRKHPRSAQLTPGHWDNSEMRGSGDDFTVGVEEPTSFIEGGRTTGSVVGVMGIFLFALYLIYFRTSESEMRVVDGRWKRLVNYRLKQETPFEGFEVPPGATVTRTEIRSHMGKESDYYFGFTTAPVLAQSTVTCQGEFSELPYWPEEIANRSRVEIVTMYQEYLLVFQSVLPSNWRYSFPCTYGTYMEAATNPTSTFIVKQTLLGIVGFHVSQPTTSK